MEVCLMCGKPFNEDVGARRIFVGDDPLCYNCRRAWEKSPKHFRFHGIRVDSDYIYNEAFASCLLQMKECGDEALAECFVKIHKEKLQRRYHGAVLCLMPSTHEKQTERGFCHLEEIFACLDLPMLQPFEKVLLQQQKSGNKNQREKMVHGIRRKQGITLPRKIVLVDDVFTTGSTMLGALRCLDLSRYQVRIYAVSRHSTWV